MVFSHKLSYSQTYLWNKGRSRLKSLPHWLNFPDPDALCIFYKSWFRLLAGAISTPHTTPPHEWQGTAILYYAIAVINGRVSSGCSTPHCQLYTSGNEIHVLCVKRNFVRVGQGSLLSLNRGFLQCGRQKNFLDRNKEIVIDSVITPFTVTVRGFSLPWYGLVAASELWIECNVSMDSIRFKSSVRLLSFRFWANVHWLSACPTFCTQIW